MVSKLLFWIPRIIAILGIIFMMMFSFDSFDGNEPFGKKILGFLIHNIPVLILITILVIAWKREFIGGILFIVVFIAGCIFFRSFTGNPQSLVVIAPFFITGIMFIVHNLYFGKK